MSWAAEMIVDKTNRWITNSLRFATREEAQEWVYDLSCRWSAVRLTRITTSDAPVTHAFRLGRLERINKE